MTRPPDELPPSAKFVADVLERRGEASRQALLRLTDLPERTLDHALGTLVEADLATKKTRSDDARRTAYEYVDSRQNGSERHD